MLAIPVHTADESAPLKTMLQDHIKSQYGDEFAKSAEKDIQTFIELRHQVLLMQESNYSEEIVGKYDAQMKNVISRFQTEGSAPSKGGLKFTWHDAYKPSIKVTNSSLIFDWVNILWNIGALLSRLGAQVNRSTDEGIKASNKYFQQSAGIFDHIQQILSTPRGRIVGTPGPTNIVLPCLSQESLNYAKNLMLAQAQLCFFEKAVRDKRTGTMKASVIAKLASQTCSLYKASFNFCKVGILGAVLDPSWSHQMEYQSVMFSGASEFFQSQAVKDIAMTEAKGYGEEIARLILAENYLSQAVALVKKYNLSTAFAESSSTFYKTTISAKQAAENDNQRVYMEAVPPANTLREITGLLMVKPLPIFDYNASLVAAGIPIDPPLFKDMLPKEVREVKINAEDKLKELLRLSTSDASESSNEARVILSSVGLPGSVESFKSGGDLPDSLWEKILRIQSLGGIPSVRSKLQELNNSSKRVVFTLGSIEENLNKEEFQDSQFRSKHSNYASATPSVVLQKDFRENLRQFREVYDKARDISDKAVLLDILGSLSEQNTDATKLLNAMALNTIPIPLLSSYETVFSATSKSQLIPLVTSTFSFPQITGVVNDLLEMDHSHETSELAGIISSLEEKLVEMARLIESREMIVAELTSSVPVATIELTTKLVERNSNGASRSDLLSIVDDTLAGFNERKSNLSMNIKQQDEVLKAILKLNEAFTKAVVTDKKTVERNIVIGKVEEIIAKYYNWQAKLSQGVTFYVNLQSRLSTLLQNCDDLAYTQQLHRQEFETQLFRSYERSNQEALDHDLAAKLAAEMNLGASSSPGATAWSNPSPAYPTAPAGVPYQPQAPPPTTAWQPPQQSYSNPQPAYPGAYAPPAYNGYGSPPPAPYYHSPPPQSFDPSFYGMAAQAPPYQPPFQPTYAAPAPVAASPSVPLANDHESKVRRIAEMGFQKHIAEHYLKANKDNEEAALNDILSASEATLNAIPDPNAPKPSSMFGKVWKK